MYYFFFLAANAAVPDNARIIAASAGADEPVLGEEVPAFEAVVAVELLAAVVVVVEADVTAVVVSVTAFSLL